MSLWNCSHQFCKNIRVSFDFILEIKECFCVQPIFGPKRDEDTGGLIKFRSEKLRDLCAPQKVLRVIKSGRKRWTGMWQL